jgi:hypothetical protein
MMHRRFDQDDPERIPPSAPALEELPLFAQAAPEPQGPDAKYARWRRTPDGEAAFGEFCRLALGEVARTPSGVYVSSKAIWEQLRRTGKHGSLDNRYTAPIAREAAATYESLRNAFEFRERKVS